MSSNKSKCPLLVPPDGIGLPNINRTSSLREIILKNVMSVLKRKKIKLVLRKFLRLLKDLVCFRLISPRALLHCFSTRCCAHVVFQNTPNPFERLAPFLGKL